MSEKSPKDPMKRAAELARKEFETQPRPTAGGSYTRKPDGTLVADEPAPKEPAAPAVAAVKSTPKGIKE